LNLNLRLRLDDSIPIIASIFGKPLIHVRAAFIWVIIQIILVIQHAGRALPIMPHERVVETGLHVPQELLVQEPSLLVLPPRQPPHVRQQGAQEQGVQQHLFRHQHPLLPLHPLLLSHAVK
jgi:hypothetical protein